MKNKFNYISKGIILLVLFFSTNSACSGLPEIEKNQIDKCERIESGLGPEDFVLQKKPGKARILISSHDRRSWENLGDIYGIDIGNNKKYKMIRKHEPKNLSFRPHGMDLLTVKNHDLLYVITHGKQMNDNDHTVSIYRIKSRSLEFVYSVRSLLFTSPNDLAVLPDGSFFVTNDAQARGSLWEMMWSLKNADVVYCPLDLNQKMTGKGHCMVAANELAMPNGILIQKDDVYVSTSRENIVYKFVNKNGKLKNKTKLAELVGQDNLFWIDNEYLLVAVHPSAMGFMKHKSSADYISPTVIYKIHSKTGKADSVFVDDGSRISAGTGAFVFRNYLYISQVFENFILKCSLKKPL